MRKKEYPAGGKPDGAMEEKRVGNLSANITLNSAVCQSSTEAQRQRIIDRLKRSPATSLQLRTLGIMHADKRISELRRLGHSIETKMVTGLCQGSVLYRIAKYILHRSERVD